MHDSSTTHVEGKHKELTELIWEPCTLHHKAHVNQTPDLHEGRASCCSGPFCLFDLSCFHLRKCAAQYTNRSSAQNCKFTIERAARRSGAAGKDPGWTAATETDRAPHRDRTNNSDNPPVRGTIKSQACRVSGWLAQDMGVRLLTESQGHGNDFMAGAE